MPYYEILNQASRSRNLLDCNSLEQEEYRSETVCTACDKQSGTAATHTPNNLLYISPCPTAEFRGTFPRLILRHNPRLPLLKRLARCPTGRILRIFIYEILIEEFSQYSDSDLITFCEHLNHHLTRGNRKRFLKACAVSVEGL